MSKYLVWNPKHGFPRYVHISKQQAIAESERLANLHPGEEFYVMAPVGVSKVEKPRIFKEFDDIPF